MLVHFARLYAFLVVFVKVVRSQTLVSPCPKLFVYEPFTEPDRWYGVVTLLSDSELSGIWLRVILDRPALQLGNWFGDVVTTDNTLFRIRKRTQKLPANTPLPLRFYIKYDPAGEIPRVVEFQLNARTFCPESGVTTQPPTTSAQLITSPELSTTLKSTFSSTSSAELSPTTTAPNRFSPTAGTVTEKHEAAVTTSTLTTNKTIPSIGVPDEDASQNFFIRPQIFSGTKPGNNDFVIDQPQAEEEECGIVPVAAQPIISHGVRVKVGEIPWHVAMYHSNGGGLEYVCGGSLISRLHIVTAGHCVTDDKTDSARVLNPDQVVVHLGKDNLKDWSSSRYQLREVEIITRHPDYNQKYYSNDIAVLKLSSAAKFTNTVRPICLCEKDEDIDNLAGTIGVIAGFGYNEHGNVAAELIKTRMPVIKQTTCIFSFPDFYSRYSSNKTFCAGFTNGTTVCNGDSGGGLVFPRISGHVNRKVYQLRGIASIILRNANIEDDRKCSPEHYPLFTDVAKYLDFIKICMKL